ncbi:MAG: glycosyltransferase family 4 protein [Cyclobacteriaceae bacterium]|nr:glycosyltransferase family 4 protein [Cyclobacteriaceae bacterium]HQQ81983.1 glycosyltransferase family 4 protein [Cyclobacteriaceae bacterium]
MKVAIVLNTSWNIYNFRMNFVRALIRQGYEVHTIAPNDEFTHYLTEAGCHHHPVKMDSRGINPIKDTALIIELWSIYRKVRPDIILHYTIKPNVYGSLAASFLRIPSINNVCGLGTVFLKDNLLSKVAKFLYRWTFRFPRKVFFQNPDDQNLFIDQKLVSAEHTDLLPGSGIDLHHFAPAPFQRNRKFTFLLISRLITDKGILEYVDAVRKLKELGIEARFQILGAKDPKHQRGIPLDLIESWINTQTIEYLGTTRDVRPFIHAADCIVLPSYREGTPHTLLEAASCSKPIITTNVPGCHQVVEHQHNGLLCKVKDADDLASTMRQMAAMDDNTLRFFGENGRRKMETEFSEDLVINKYIASIKEVEQAG